MTVIHILMVPQYLYNNQNSNAGLAGDRSTVADKNTSG